MRREFIIFLIVAWGAAAQAAIVDVIIEPEEPSISDPISIIVSGMEGSGPVEISNSEFHIDGTSLELDLFLQVGFYTMMTPWEYCEDIGMLPAGLYELTVWAYPDYYGPSNYNTTFEVIPEPATLLLIGLGGLALRRQRG